MLPNLRHRSTSSISSPCGKKNATSTGSGPSGGDAMEGFGDGVPHAQTKAEDARGRSPHPRRHSQVEQVRRQHRQPRHSDPGIVVPQGQTQKFREEATRPSTDGRKSGRHRRTRSGSSQGRDSSDRARSRSGSKQQSQQRHFDAGRRTQLQQEHADLQQRYHGESGNPSRQRSSSRGAPQVDDSSHSGSSNDGTEGLHVRGRKPSRTRSITSTSSGPNVGEPGLRIKTRLSLQEHQQQHQHVLMSPAPQPRRRASAVANMRGHHNHHTPSPRAQAAAAAAAASRKVAPNPSNSAAKKQSQHHRQLSRDSGSQRLHMSGGATSDASFPFSPAAQQAAAAAAASRKVRLQQSGGAMSEDSGSFQSSISSKADADVPLPARRPSRVITRTVLDASRSGRDSSRGSGSRSRSKQPPPSRRRSIHDDEYSDSGSESGISAGEERNFADPHNSSSPMGRALLDSSFAHPGPTNWRQGTLLGTGSYGSVFKGLNEDTGAIFAVKRIRMMESGEAADSAIASLEREISLLRGLEHVNIVKYLGTQRSSGHLHIFLEYVPGGSIASLLSEFGKFEENLVRVYTRQIAEGVAYLHNRHIIHRDIKGGNVLVSGSGCLKLADFGCSKQLQGLRTTALENSLKAIRGSVPWMAPEVIRQTGHGRKADVWSIGATIVEMLTARHPWPSFDNNITALFHVATAGSGPPLPDGLSDLCHDALDECFKLDPDVRCSAAELLKHPFCADAPSFRSPNRRLQASHNSSFRSGKSAATHGLSDSDEDEYSSDEGAEAKSRRRETKNQETMPM
eukprot:INCI12119.1.p1 GENE.INCI12119.1~~INCI12119.1.p1  ORF type:complete len:793 (-),score=101.38 INCI12119.1:80-2458(-)